MVERGLIISTTQLQCLRNLKKLTPDDINPAKSNHPTYVPVSPQGSDAATPVHDEDTLDAELQEILNDDAVAPKKAISPLHELQNNNSTGHHKLVVPQFSDLPE